MTKPLRVFFAMAIVAGITVSSSLAATVPLSDLLDGGEFVSGNKTFTNFTYTTKPDRRYAIGRRCNGDRYSRRNPVPRCLRRPGGW